MRFDVFFLLIDIRFYFCEIFISIFIELDLFGHIESWQPVIYHEERGDIIKLETGIIAGSDAFFDGMFCIVAVSADGEEIFIF